VAREAALEGWPPATSPFEARGDFVAPRTSG
jgi:hypothetical protein